METEGCEVRIRIVKTHGDINIEIDPVAMNFLTGQNKNIDLRGPVFTTASSWVL